MKRPNHRTPIAGIVVAALMVPALIWSGMRTLDAAANADAVKLPEVSTIGPDVKPYKLTPLEREKLQLPVRIEPLPLEFQQETTRRATVHSQAKYPGMTNAELEKLVRMREATSGPWTGSPVRQKGPISTIEVVPRAPGIEGLTPRERAKLEAYLKSRK